LVQLVVERASYTSPNGITWAAGADAVATKLLWCWRTARGWPMRVNQLQWGRDTEVAETDALDVVVKASPTRL
jgi:hypothetical protein